MARNVRILLFDLNPSRSLSETLEKILRSSPRYRVELKNAFFCDETPLCDLDAVTRISRFRPDVLFLVLSPAHLSNLDALAEFIRSTLSDQRIMVVIEGGEPEQVAELFKVGTVDFIAAPLRTFDLLTRLARLLEAPLSNQSLARRMKERLGLKQLVGESPVFLAEVNKIPVVANSDATVLIYGETGTGKELCARAIHYLSRRSDRAFIAVNCGAVPVDLMENELFGHAQGAFTGAGSTQDGLIREADQGTLFLDEVDCLPLTAQVKLLRFLQDREYKMLGSAKLCRADVRIIAAANVDLERTAQEGKFRLDLLYRLNVVSLALPPLRERKEDIPSLARHFLDKYAFEFEKDVCDFSPEAMRVILLHTWPGNVRELENVVERAVIFAEQKTIQYEEILLSRSEPLPQCPPSFKTAKAMAVEQFEKRYIRELLVASHGNISLAAKVAQKNRRAFWELIRRHRINTESFRSTSA